MDIFTLTREAKTYLFQEVILAQSVRTVERHAMLLSVRDEVVTDKRATSCRAARIYCCSVCWNPTVASHSRTFSLIWLLSIVHFVECVELSECRSDILKWQRFEFRRIKCGIMK